MNSSKYQGKWLLFGGLVILSAIAAGALSLWRYETARPKPVVTAPAPAVFDPVGSEINLTGQIQAQKVVNVAAPIEGVIESFAVEVGQDVVEGQLLARIKNVRVETALQNATEEADRAQTRVQNTEAAITAARLEASRARAESSRVHAELERAVKAFERQKLLFAEGATPRLAYEKAEAEYKQLKDEDQSKQTIAQQAEDRIEALNRDLLNFKKTAAARSDDLEQAKDNAGAGDLHSPVDGVIIARRGEPGERIAPDVEDFFKIGTTLSALEIMLEPNPAQLARIKAGQPVAIHVAELPNEPIPGTVREITGNRVIIDFTSPTPLVKPGLSAQVSIKLT